MAKTAKNTATGKKGFAQLKRSSIPMNFVKKNNGSWDHAKWLEFLDYIKSKGYEVDDIDQVGLLLESKKERYFTDKKK